MSNLQKGDAMTADLDLAALVRHHVDRMFDRLAEGEDGYEQELADYMAFGRDLLARVAQHLREKATQLHVPTKYHADATGPYPPGTEKTLEQTLIEVADWLEAQPGRP